ncbi:MAG TPA: alpha/beta hydrolase [Rubrivivax sp.]|nr:alpha/beta hydrolase [Rubrivivax sp.]
MGPVALGLALAAALLFAGPALMQERLLYFPARVSVAQASAGGLQPWPDAQDFRGLLARAEGVPRGTAIVFHGNAGHAGDRGFYAQALTPLGLRVILAEYPGYGPRGGKLGEASLVDDAARSIELAHAQFGAPLLVVGESLGAGVAAAAAERQRAQVAGLLLITPWNTLADVAAFHYPWLPVRRLLRDRYDSVAHLQHVDAPVAVVLAEHDDIVPARLGQALHDALPGRKQRVLLPGAGHNDWPATTDAHWWQQRIDFLLGAPPS